MKKAKHKIYENFEFPSPFHPGEILLDEFLIPLNMTQIALSEMTGWTRARVLIKGKHGITADAALDLSEALGTNPAFWLNMQAAWDLAAARKKRAA
jgi:addiction module HigA family antidote